MEKKLRTCYGISGGSFLYSLGNRFEKSEASFITISKLIEEIDKVELLIIHEIQPQRGKNEKILD